MADQTPAEQAVQHTPIQIGTHDTEGYRTHTIPGDVCLDCSSPATGRWVPVSQCPQALATLDAEELPGDPPAVSDAPDPARDSAWADFEWPTWIPAVIRAEIERFWGARSHRDPSAWQRNSAHNNAPHLGQVVTLPVLALGKPVPATGRFVFCWNNIGRLVHDDGTWTYTSFGPDWAASQPAPLSEVPAPTGTEKT